VGNEIPLGNEVPVGNEFSFGEEFPLAENQVYKNRFALNLKNKICVGEELEFIGPDLPLAKTKDYRILNKDGLALEEVNHNETCYIEIDLPLKEGYLIRRLPHEGELPEKGR
jgi:hypothetical protein